MLRRQRATSSSLLSLVPRSVVLAQFNMTASNTVSSNGSTATKLDKKILLQSICRYLKSSGFSKTVKKLKSEAKLDEDELSDTLILDLEEICSKHLEARAHASVASRKSDQDLKANGNIKACEGEISNSDKVSKKKKKVKNDDRAGVDDEPGSKSIEIPKTEVHTEPEDGTKEKKKTKKSVGSSKQDVNSENNASKCENGTDTEKKKKKKKTNQNPDEVTNENDAKNASDAASEKHHKSKDKKKANKDVEDSQVDTKESKKRKRASAEDDTDKGVDASPDDKSNHIKTGEAIGSVANKSEAKFGDTTPNNGVANPNSGDKSSGRKSAKKPRNGSAEPTTVKAFQRVKADEVVIKDERLKDNSYWAKDGAESGYGAKAQEILGQVRGKDFRHEKTKKKRGSYRGGHIDFDSHSVKFNDSDDE